MEGSNFQTSFIPKKPLVEASGKPPRTTNFLSLIATVVFFTTIVITGGIYGYTFYLQTTIKNVKTDLETELSKIKQDDINDLIRIDNRIESAKAIMNGHVAISGFFDFLNRTTIYPVRYNTFSYSMDGDMAKVTMTGQALSYGAIQSQLDEFLKENNTKYIQNPTFSGLSLDTRGNVLFTFAARVNPKYLLYADMLSDSDLSQTSVSTDQGTTTQATTTSAKSGTNAQNR
jgi:hypothetical protein